MLLSETPIHDVLKLLLGKRVSFVVKGKRKEGTLQLFSQRGFFIILKIVDDEKKTQSYEIPYPFSFQYDEKSLVFDYHFKNFYLDNEESKSIIEGMVAANSGKKNKYIDFLDRSFLIEIV